MSAEYLWVAQLAEPIAVTATVEDEA